MVARFLERRAARRSRQPGAAWGSASWSYQSNDWLSRQTLPNGAYSDYTYLDTGALASLTNKTSGGTTLSGFSSMTRDGVGNLTGLTASVPADTSLSGTSSWTHDSKDRLTNETTTRGNDWNHAFGYDNTSNPTQWKSTSTNRSFNADNQETTGTNQFAHDGNGNPTTYGGVTATWSVENRLTSYGTGFTAGYTGDKLRAWKDNGTAKTYYLYDGLRVIAELDSTGSVTATWSWGANGLYARGSTQYLYDPQGSVTERLDGNGSVLSRHLFDAYGSEQTTAQDPIAWNGQWGYLRDGETGLYLCTYRYYDASRGRWLNRDPIGYDGGVNLYGYRGRNPSGWIATGELPSQVGALDWRHTPGRRQFQRQR